MPTPDAALAAELRQALGRLHRRIRSERGEAGLSFPQFSVLALLTREGPTTPGRLADLEGVQPPTMTRTVNSLAELAFVTKADDPDDGRQVVVTLTPAGAAEVAETRRRRDAWLTRQLSRLTKEDRAVLARATELLQELAAS